MIRPTIATESDPVAGGAAGCSTAARTEVRNRLTQRDSHAGQGSHAAAAEEAGTAAAAEAEAAQAAAEAAEAAEISDWFSQGLMFMQSKVFNYFLKFVV